MTIDFKQVSSIRVLKKILADLPKNKKVPVRVLRNNRSVFLPLKIED
jgi:serine protease Do